MVFSVSWWIGVRWRKASAKMNQMCFGGTRRTCSACGRTYLTFSRNNCSRLRRVKNKKKKEEAAPDGKARSTAQSATPARQTLHRFCVLHASFSPEISRFLQSEISWKYYPDCHKTYIHVFTTYIHVFTTPSRGGERLN